jgi:hypothetical protein
MLHLQIALVAENAIDWAQSIPAVIGLGGVVIGGLITFGTQAWERHLTRTAKMMSEVAEIVVLSTPSKVDYRPFTCPLSSTNSPRSRLTRLKHPRESCRLFVGGVVG